MVQWLKLHASNTGGLKHLPGMWEAWVRSLGQEDPLEEETHSSILAWKTPWTEKPDGLQPMGSQSQTQLSTHAQRKLNKYKTR